MGKCRQSAYGMSVSIKATVRNGRLVVNEPTDLPEGTVLHLVVDAQGDDFAHFDEVERQALFDALEQGYEQMEQGLGRLARTFLQDRRSRSRQ